jgi:hypothetical protein
MLNNSHLVSIKSHTPPKRKEKMKAELFQKCKLDSHFKVETQKWQNHQF